MSYSQIYSMTPPDAHLWPILLPLGLGLVAVYLLLPRPRRYRPLLAAFIAALAILFAGFFLTHSGGATPETVLFYSFAALAVVAGGMLVTQRNPVHAALSFALVVLSTCGLFLLQAAPFLMAATIIVYAGAIIVTFLFVIMLAQQAGLSDADARSREPLLACVAGFVLLGALLYVLRGAFITGDRDEQAIALKPPVAATLSAYSGPAPNRVEPGTVALPAENVAGLGVSLFTDYLFAVELGGTLLLVATVGAIAIAGRREGGVR